MAVYRSADEKALLADSALLHIYHYYERASLGGTADDREALQRFGRICLVLSRHHSEKANTDRFLHLAIHCAEAAEDPSGLLRLQRGLLRPPGPGRGLPPHLRGGLQRAGEQAGLRFHAPAAA